MSEIQVLTTLDSPITSIEEYNNRILTIKQLIPHFQSLGLHVIVNGLKLQLSALNSIKPLLSVLSKPSSGPDDGDTLD